MYSRIKHFLLFFLKITQSDFGGEFAGILTKVCIPFKLVNKHYLLNNGLLFV